MEDLGVAPRGLCVKDAMTNPMVRKADRPPAGAPQRQITIHLSYGDTKRHIASRNGRASDRKGDRPPAAGAALLRV